MSLDFLDLAGFLDVLDAKTDSIGITEKTAPCVTYESIIEDIVLQNNALEVCKDSSKYLFYDLLHPTTKAHKAFADEIAALL